MSTVFLSRKVRLQEIDVEARSLQAQLDALYKERRRLNLEQEHEDFPCECVKLNKDVEIYDMGEQERRGRCPVSFGAGFVSESLSCRKDCTTCNGTGVPGKTK